MNPPKEPLAKPLRSSVPAPQPKTENPSTDPELKPVMTDVIPVKQPAPHAGPSDAETNPIAGASLGNQPATEEEMNKILDDVSQKVKAAPQEEKPSFLSRFKKHEKADQNVAAPPDRKPILVAAVAIVVGLTLAAFAYFAFASQQPAQQPISGAQNPPVVDSSVTSSDIDQLSEDIQTDIDSLNDNQDFDSASLSDSALGL